MRGDVKVQGYEDTYFPVLPVAGFATSFSLSPLTTFSLQSSSTNSIFAPFSWLLAIGDKTYFLQFSLLQETYHLLTLPHKWARNNRYIDSD
jgi:hypothetical protein